MNWRIQLGRYPEPTVGALIVRGDGKIFFAKSRKWLGNYTVPGGHIELGESVEEAIKREVKEETGLQVKPVALLSVQEVVYSKEFSSEKHFIFLDFLCRMQSGKVKLDRRELNDYVWIGPKEALKLNLNSFTRNLVSAYLRGQRSRTKNLGVEWFKAR